MKNSATITMPTNILNRLREIAKSEKRTLSQQLEMIVENHFGGPSKTARKSSKKTAA